MAISTRAGKMAPVRRVNLASQIMDRVKEYIVENDLRSGDRLPTEKELTERLGVSRNILREALKSLEAVGLIEIKVGDGMYVSDFDYSIVVNHISFALSRVQSEMEHVLQARLVIEVGSLELLMQNLTDEDISRLREVSNRSETAPSIEESAREDLRFHKELLAIAGNPVLSEFGSFLTGFFAEAQRLVGDDAKYRAARGHRELISALEARDLVKAQEIMREHILTWEPVRP